MLIGDTIREYKIAEENFKGKKEDLVKELNTILEMLPFKVYGYDDDSIDSFYVTEKGEVRINWYCMD